MKSFRIDKDEAFSDENVLRAFQNPAMGKKKKRPDVKKILANLENEVPVVKEMLYAGTFQPKRKKPQRLNDPFDKKERYIIKPDYKYEQVVHHVAVQAIKPAVFYGMYAYTLGSIPNRGLHMGKKAIERWIREDPENTRYVLKMDIRKFFPSVDHTILKRWLAKKFRDKYLLDLLYTIIDTTEHGLPLGFYPSPWFANFLLQPLDHYIKEELHVKYMTRYADDIVCFGADKTELHRVQARIARYLEDELGLHMKDNWQVFPLEYYTEESAVTCRALKELEALDKRLTAENIPHKVKTYRGKRRIFTGENISHILPEYRSEAITVQVPHGRPLDYMGFLFYRDKTILRKAIMLRMSRKARRLSEHSKINSRDAGALLSYIGWLLYTNTYGFYLEYIKPFVKIKTLKSIVSKKQRRLNQHGIKLENRNRLPGGKAAGDRQNQQSKVCLSSA